MTHDALHHNPGEESEIDVRRVLFGYYDPKESRSVPGLVSIVAKHTDALELSNRIDSFVVRGLAAFALLKFLGLDDISKITKLLGGH